MGGCAIEMGLRVVVLVVFALRSVVTRRVFGPPIDVRSRHGYLLLYPPLPVGSVADGALVVAAGSTGTGCWIAQIRVWG